MFYDVALFLSCCMDIVRYIFLGNIYIYLLKKRKSSQCKGELEREALTGDFPPWWKPALALLQALWIFF